MKYKEKEKLWLSVIKDQSKTAGWKFKGYFIYKAVDNFFFSATFYVSRNENSISGYLDYKPLNIDNVFWDIINEAPNKKKPLSFRAEAAFCVQDLNLFRYEINIADEANPQAEIEALLKTIMTKVNEKLEKIKVSPNIFYEEMMENEKDNGIGIVTFLIEQERFDEALIKIEEYKINKLKSGFGYASVHTNNALKESGFIVKDFYDVAKEYCIKNHPSTSHN